jgi:hypothetical protein
LSVEGFGGGRSSILVLLSLLKAMLKLSSKIESSFIKLWCKFKVGPFPVCKLLRKLIFQIDAILVFFGGFFALFWKVLKLEPPGILDGSLKTGNFSLISL